MSLTCFFAAFNIFPVKPVLIRGPCCFSDQKNPRSFETLGNWPSFRPNCLELPLLCSSTFQPTTVIGFSKKKKKTCWRQPTQRSESSFGSYPTLEDKRNFVALRFCMMTCLLRWVNSKALWALRKTGRFRKNTVRRKFTESLTVNFFLRKLKKFLLSKLWAGLMYH